VFAAADPDPNLRSARSAAGGGRTRGHSGHGGREQDRPDRAPLKRCRSSTSSDSRLSGILCVGQDGRGLKELRNELSGRITAVAGAPGSARPAC
jgi:hypothetical protein